MESSQELFRQQDEHLDEISEIAKRLHNYGKTINSELKDQEVMLKGLDNQLDANIEKMNFVMKKLAKLMKTSDTKTLCTIITLMVILFVLMILVFYT
mmetsp:Transcript_21739/g.39662  ORF Transcript_21739/g.39662 Transcript_21739/m.39662 type:complete len:97 (+) Transcript_21739:571-861(+)|eukprot:CAMPEP_0204910672 /NCGR_PEP_ID=MMETSP1397-20131031/9143_1 /ASSEMBLY_ACC=CAM_ASM_000891 /TAXON_ID=49980 /ORGANISM="Climacostomum Climacostomum virens, Strain Stock W-24" /LENGTH=96 /DNA_ID=CAMNT_0052080915 /DNA_START=529 /DNA_END=819 /DNA_ORIENTATION=-